MVERDEFLVGLLPAKGEVSWEPAPDDMVGVLATFPLTLEPGGRWELRVSARPESASIPAGMSVPVSLGQSTADRASITTDNPFFNRLLSRSLDDLAALVSRFPDGHLVAAGIPWFVAPFGRDSLIAGLQTVHVAPRDAEGTLRVLASLQGARRDAFTEEQPGKIPHEMRYGEMARTGEVPHRPYYGSIDSTSLFVLFAETVAWTGDDALYAGLLPSVQLALTWIEQYGDLDGDGLIEYRGEQTSPIHIRHQVWKDSGDSLHHVDGRPPRGYIAPVEVQAIAMLPISGWQRWQRHLVTGPSLRRCANRPGRSRPDSTTLSGWKRSSFTHRHWTATSRIWAASPRTRASCCLPASPRRSRPGRCPQTTAARHGVGLGRAHAQLACADVQPDELSQRLGLAARQ